MFFFSARTAKSAEVGPVTQPGGRTITTTRTRAEEAAAARWEDRERVAAVVAGGTDREEVGEEEESWYGWLVVAASFLCNMVIDGMGYSFGVMLQPLMAEFQVRDWSGEGGMTDTEL